MTHEEDFGFKISACYSRHHVHMTPSVRRLSQLRMVADVDREMVTETQLGGEEKELES